MTTTKLIPREPSVVTRDEAFCSTTEDARRFLCNVLENAVECIPMEADCGRNASFATAVDGLGYTISYDTEPVGDESLGIMRCYNIRIERNESYDMAPCECNQYRIRFYESAEVRIDPFEFAWMLSAHYIEVTAKADRPLYLFVHARSRADLLDFTHDVNRAFGPLIFESIEGASRYGYEEIDFS